MLLVFGLTTAAGLATGGGAALALWRGRFTFRLLAIALGLSAGILVFLSLAQALPRALEHLAKTWSGTKGSWALYGGFFGGMLLSLIVDALVPEAWNPHERRAPGDLSGLRGAAAGAGGRRLGRTGARMIAAMMFHRLPEGMALFLVSLYGPISAVALFLAMSLHNLAEGIGMAVPLHQATDQRRRALLWSLGCGLAQPLGALAVWYGLNWFCPQRFLGLAFAAAAGILVHIALDGLFPYVRESERRRQVVGSVLLGMALVAVSLLLYK